LGGGIGDLCQERKYWTAEKGAEAELWTATVKILLRSWILQYKLLPALGVLQQQ